ncbi:MAG: molecular chaperone HtpG [Clostridia bacterium]|nr:molecular chaperone HtpG [Clostridia bacterium]
MKKQGNIQISSENMMPIIKKWLYSDKDIFLREIVANGTDAITKFKKLIDLGNAENPQAQEYCVKVYTDKAARTLTVEDNGIGMTAEEVEKYITQVAFSGAADFLSTYEKAGGEGIIGHFGLGFYSAYMVSDNIEIFTKSYQNTPAVHWESDGNSTYTMEQTEKAERGTKIVMHIAEGEDEFLNENTVRALLRKYCEFMPYNIYLNPTDKVNEEGKKEDMAVNDTAPLYLKTPSECTEEEYKTFYRNTFSDYAEPLFWVHLNMEYPFRLKGILYFPKVKNKVELERGKVKLFCNQVFIAENIKEVIPEYLMLLNGVIDCPDIPLNVSRSFLQNDRQVQKISKYISKKVADALIDLFRKDREKYENCWEDTSVFVKFGCMKDEDFYQKIKDVIIYKNLSDKFMPISSYFGAELTEEEQKEGKQPKPVYYVSDKTVQAQYVQMFKDAELDAIYCDTYLDPHFISFLEYKEATKARFLRIDAEIDQALKATAEDSDQNSGEEIQKIFTEALKEQNITVQCNALKNSNVPAIVNVNEFMRRMNEMNRFYGMGEGMQSLTLVVNTANQTVKKVKDLPEEKQKVFAKHVYYLALLSYRSLTMEEMQEFTQNNLQLLEKL